MIIYISNRKYLPYPEYYFEFFYLWKSHLFLFSILIKRQIMYNSVKHETYNRTEKLSKYMSFGK